MAHIGKPQRVVVGVPEPVEAPIFLPIKYPQPVEEERELVPIRVRPQQPVTRRL